TRAARSSANSDFPTPGSPINSVKFSVTIRFGHSHLISDGISDAIGNNNPCGSTFSRLLSYCFHHFSTAVTCPPKIIELKIRNQECQFAFCIFHFAFCNRPCEQFVGYRGTGVSPVNNPQQRDDPRLLFVQVARTSTKHAAISYIIFHFQISNS